MSLRLAILSTYPPRRCGLATFAAHLREGLLAAGAAQVDVAAVVREPGAPAGGPEVSWTLRQEHAPDYRQAARSLDAAGLDAVLLQHEFGIFGGEAGRYVLDLLAALRTPAVVTLHTVLAEPAPEYREVLQAVAERAAALVVMARRGAELLAQVYGVPADRIAQIPHGVPPLPAESAGAWKERLGLTGRTVAMTFGLLGPGKGIETALRAVARAVARCPDLLYLVVGATHPEVLRCEGERYRHSLEAMTAALGLQGHVRFVGRYLEEPELLGYLQACDIYLTPYPGSQQITSGTLTYALGMGKAVISTPYTYARELLGDGAGLLVPFGDEAAMGEALADLARRPQRRAALGAAARERTRGFTWPEVGARYLQLVAGLQRRQPGREPAVTPAAAAAAPAAGAAATTGAGTATTRAGTPAGVPVPRLEHLRRLTDDTGVIQHALGGLPHRASGYTADDNARALLVALRALRAGEAGAAELADTYMAFLAYAQEPDGWFHNFFAYNRRPLPEVRSEDCQGRCLWALAEAARTWAGSAQGWSAAQLFARGLAPCQALRSVRGWAGTAVAAAAWLDREAGDTQQAAPEGGPEDEVVRRVLTAAADRLVQAWQATRGPGWEWFEASITYDNGLLPYALLRAARLTGEGRYREAGLDTLAFLCRVTWREGVFWPVGNQGWYRRGETPAAFAQQPVEAAGMVLACQEAWAQTGDPAWQERAWAALRWFLGENALGLSLYDDGTGGCHDGLEAHGVNRNQGAESTLAWLLAAYTLVAEPALLGAVR